MLIMSVDTTTQPLRVTTPVGANAFILEDFSGVEALSQPFVCQLTLLADPDKTSSFTFDQLLGQSVTVTIQPVNTSATIRYFTGLVHKLLQGPQVRGDDDNANPWVRYQAEIVPQWYFLKRNHNLLIFQQMTVPDILKQVMASLNCDWQIQGTFEPRDYVVQYRETDFDFCSRLMEEEGIYYYFKHTSSSCQMVVANTPTGHQAITDTVNFDDRASGQYTDDVVFAWEKSQAVRSGKCTLWDYTFQMQDKNLECDKSVTTSASVGTVTHQLAVASNSNYELYDYPGGYAGRFDGVQPGGGDQADKLQKIFTDNTRTVGIRMDQETMPALAGHGRGTIKCFTAGYKFTLAKHYNANGDFVLTKVEHVASLRSTSRAGVASALGGKLQYENRFQCLPFAVPFRPLQITPKARCYGMQTAKVVGPSGQEIFTDKFSRVKVQFNWDRKGTNDANSSCWIRVGSTWAGKQWGAIHIPRIGQEVIVAFLEGDPDQPIIVGSVYNAEQMPPYTLPDNMTQSGIKSHSTTEGTEDTFNELRFEDKKGSEQVYFHAEKDFVHIVENNATVQIGYQKQDGDHKSDDGSQTIKIYKDRTTTLDTGNETLTISKGNRTETISEGNDSLTISKGNRTETISQGTDSLTVQSDRSVTVNQGNDSWTVSQGNRSATVSQGNDTLTISQGNLTISVSAGKVEITAGTSITLTVGSNTIKMDTSSITLTAGQSSLALQSSSATLQGMSTTVKGTSSAELSAPSTTVSGTGTLTVKGGMVSIN
jgi:type VI secretion system secreted protein VgrG